MTTSPVSDAELANSTPVLETMVLPEVEYPEAAQAVIDQMVYKFPSCANCP